MTSEQFQNLYGFSLEEALNAKKLYYIAWYNQPETLGYSTRFWISFIDKGIIYIDEYGDKRCFHFYEYNKLWSFNEEVLKEML